MRESIGATWIFSICLTFIILFTAYLAISVNYAKAFRIKNHIINIIEENEGYSDDLDGRISEYLVAEGYTAAGRCSDRIAADNSDSDWNLYKCINYVDGTEERCNACVYRLAVDRRNDDFCTNGAYYKVVAFFKFDLPVVSYFTTFAVKGDTRLVKYDFATESC